MRRKVQRYYWVFLVLALGVAADSSAQQPPQNWTWENVKDRFEQQNPTLLADKLSVDESKAEEITAFLRPNPDVQSDRGRHPNCPGSRRLETFRRHF